MRAAKFESIKVQNEQKSKWEPRLVGIDKKFLNCLHYILHEAMSAFTHFLN